MSVLTHSFATGQSPLERLPAELLRKILIFVALNPSSNTTNSFQENNINAKPVPSATSLPCLLTSKKLHVTALPVMYRDIMTTLPSTFTRFLAQLRCYPSLGKYIRSLNLSPVCSNHTRPENEVLANPLPGVLQLTPLLREFKISQSIQDHLDRTVLQHVFCDLPYLELIDLSNCNSQTFAWEFAQLSASSDFHTSNSITTLTLHGCSNLQSQIFSVLLPQLLKLKYLDLADTQITTAALSTIPNTAQITHLNLSNCALSGSELTHFLRSHPAVISKLEILNLNTSIENSYLNEEDVTSILAHAPPTLRSLGMKNSHMTETHIPHLRRLGKQLEELNVGSYLRMRDLEAIFLSPSQLSESEGSLEEEEEANPALESESKYSAVLDPMETAVAVCKVRRRIDSVSTSSAEGQGSKLKVLDISSMAVAEQGKIRMSVLLGPQSGGLEKVEISEKVMGKMGVLKRVCKAVGWDLISMGRRCWIWRIVNG